MKPKSVDEALNEYAYSEDGEYGSGKYTIQDVKQDLYELLSIGMCEDCKQALAKALGCSATNMSENDKEDKPKYIVDELTMQRIIASKHIYVAGHCDTDDFVTVPIIELSKAIVHYLKERDK